MTVRLTTSDGHPLAADVVDPDGMPAAAVVVCHPHPLYGGNRYHPVVDAVFRLAPTTGIRAIRFDFRADHDNGRGERLDLVAALEAIASGATGPAFVVGYSFGAAVAMTTEDDRIAAVVAVAPPLVATSPPPVRPTLILTPSDDQFCPPAAAAAIAATWPVDGPDVALEVVDSADHFLLGRADEIARRAISWISDRIDAS
jgi:alpha/beta superfamily hydrolase